MEKAMLDSDKFQEALEHAHIGPIPYFTQYESTGSYSLEPSYPQYGMGLIHNFTHLLFDKYYDSEESVTDDYIMGIDNSTTFALGPKFGANAWHALLYQNSVLLWWVLLLLLIITCVPFIAVLYFCFGWFRCPKTCPPCDRKSKARERLCYSILLLLLIMGIILGLIIAFLNDKLIGNTLRNSNENIRRGRQDTCAFLKDACAHVNHILVNNYEELDTHLNAALMGAVNHVSMDLTTASGLYLMSELQRILENMPTALRLMQRVEKLQLSLAFRGSQYRDGLRGAKRDLNYIFTVLCDYRACNKFIRQSKILSLDTSKCLHIDNLPNTTNFISTIENIIIKQHNKIVKKWVERWKDGEKLIQDELKPIVPPLVEKFKWLGFALRIESKKICEKINATMNHIYHRDFNLTRHFEELDDHFGSTRRLFTMIVFVCIFAIVLILISAVFCGLCVRRDNTGSNCLILCVIYNTEYILFIYPPIFCRAIFMIFIVLSFLTLIGLFYFMLGLVTYPACILRDDRGKNTLFHMLNQKEPWHQTKMTCSANQSIIEVLRENQLYDIEDVRTIYEVKIPSDVYKAVPFKTDIKFIEPVEEHALQEMRRKYLGIFNSSVYTKNLCTRFAPVDVRSLIDVIDTFSDRFFKSDAGVFIKRRFSVALNNVKKVNLDISKYQPLESKLVDDIIKIRKYVRQIDDLITIKNQTFGQTVNNLLRSISKAENFVRSYGGEFSEKVINIVINSALQQIEEYINNAINETTNKVGQCRPLAYIYDRNTDVICQHLINPINGYWVGLLICALLFLPVLFVAHRLICLYRVYATSGSGIVTVGGYSCPTCTGAPYQPPPIVICTNKNLWTTMNDGKNKSD